MLLTCALLPTIRLATAADDDSGVTGASSGVTQDDQDEQSLQQVTVEGTRPQYEQKLSPGTVSIVYPEQQKGEQKTLADLLKEVPGVHIEELNGAGQYTVASIRGSTSAQVGVFVDGVLAKLGGDAATDLSTIPVENVVRIEVYRGYVPARFPGSWMGGVINIVTKKPQKLSGSVLAGVSSYGGYTGGLDASAPLGNGSLLFGAHRDQSKADFSYDDYAEEVTQREGAAAGGTQNLPVERTRYNNGWNNSDGLLKWQNEHWQLQGTWKLNDRQLPTPLGTTEGSNPCVDVANCPGSKYSTPDAGAHSRINQWDLLAGRRWRWGNLEWGIRATYLEQAKNFWNPEGVSYSLFAQWSRYVSQRGGGAIDGSYKLGAWQLFEFVGNYSKEEMYVNGSDILDRPDVKRYYTQGLGDLQTQDTITVPWVQDLWLTPSVSLNESDGLGRALTSKVLNLTWEDALDENSGARVSYQAALKKKFGEHYTLHSSYGSYVRFPNLYELVGDGAFILPVNPSYGLPPGPEHGTQWDLGGQWQGSWQGGNADVGLTYFGRYSYDLLGLYKSSAIFWSYINIGSGKADGVELEAHLTEGPVDVDLSGTAMKTVVLSPYTWLQDAFAPNPSYDKPFGNTPDDEGSLRLTYRIIGERLAVLGELHYVGSFYIDKVDEYTPLTTVGLALRSQLTSSVKLTAGVKDLLNAGPQQRDYYPGQPQSEETNPLYPLQGRTFYGTAQWSF